MINRKGPFGCFATETVSEDVSVSEYAMAVIESNSSDCFLPCLINRYGAIREFSFDYSGLIPISEFDCTGKTDKRFPNIPSHGRKLEQRRKAIGTFLIQIPMIMNKLLPPEGVVLSPLNIYTDKDGSIIRCCYRPLEYRKSTLRLSAVNINDMEHLISTDFISDVLTEDEKQSLLHAVSTGDEDMYCSCCMNIRSSAGKYSKKGQDKGHSGLKDALSIRQDLIIPVLTVICAVYSYVSVGRKAAFLFAGAGLILTALVIIKDRKDQGSKTVSLQDQGQLRRRILFSDERSGTFYDEGTDASRESGDDPYDIHYASLRSITEGTEDEPKQFSIYTDKVTIGSDRFLSDIVIEDGSVDSQHATITYDNGRYYLTDLSVSNTTYIDDKILYSGKQYEIKNDQKLTFGDQDYRFLISFYQDRNNKK